MRKPKLDQAEALEQDIEALSKESAFVVEDFHAEPTPEYFYDFCKDVLDYKDMRPQPHYELCNFLESLLAEYHSPKQVQTCGMILLPRNTFKTVTAVVGLAAHEIKENRNIRILVVSHNQAQANERALTIRNHLTHNEKFRALYGEDWQPAFRESVWKDSKFTIKGRTKILVQATVTAAAVGANITGSHFDIILADDIVQKENTYTQTYREKVYLYMVMLRSLLESSKGLMLVVGTRWHDDDAYGRLTKLDAVRENRGEDPIYRKLVRSCEDGPNGQYFPEKLTPEYLRDIKEQYGPRYFAANYYNKTIADEDVVFSNEYYTEKDFTYYSQGGRNGVIMCDGETIPVSVTLAWDTAGTKSTNKSDFHGITVRGTDSLGRCWVIDAIRAKGRPSEVVTEVGHAVSRYRPAKLIIEAIGSWEFWVDSIRAYMTQFACMTPIVEASHGGVPKEERIVRLEPLWCNRYIIMRKGQDALHTEFDNFSMAGTQGHDDLIDSLQMHIPYVGRPSASSYMNDSAYLDKEYIEFKKRQEPPKSYSKFRTRRRTWGL